MSTSRSGEPQGIARHGQLKSVNPFLKVLGFLGVAVVVVAISATSLVAIAATQFATTVGNNVVDLNAGQTDAGQAAPKISELTGGVNLLLLGLDNDPTQAASSFGKRGGATLNDVNMLLHISEDQTSAVVVSFPRDLIVPIPSCAKVDGKGSYSAMTAQALNSAYSYGGLACVNKTIENLTGLEIPFAATVSFNGVVNMSTAVGGVNVCVASKMDDPYTGIHLAAGNHVLAGVDALQFLRSRHGLKDGSDLARISSQQNFLSSLVRTVKSDGTLTNPVKLYSLATAATQSMQLSSSLYNLDTMVEMAKILAKVDLTKMAFVQYPGSTASTQYPGKVVPIKGAADQLFALIKADTPVVPTANNSGNGTTTDPNAPAADPNVVAPTPNLPAAVHGQLASTYTCSG